MAYDASLITTKATAITKSDTTEVSFFGFYVGATGDVAVVPSGNGPNGASVIFVSVPAGQIIPLAICKVLSTGTTASSIVGFGPT